MEVGGGRKKILGYKQRRHKFVELILVEQEFTDLKLGDFELGIKEGETTKKDFDVEGFREGDIFEFSKTFPDDSFFNFLGFELSFFIKNKSESFLTSSILMALLIIKFLCESK
jgi:hypothetical protein